MTSLNPSLLHVFVRRTIAAQAIRSFSEASRKRVNFNQFGSIQQSDIPIEKPLRPKRDFDNPRPTTSKHRIRELTTTRVAKKHETVVVEESSVECSRKDYNPNRYEDGHLVLFSKYWDKNKYKDQWIKVRKTAKQAKPGVALCTWDEFVPDLLDPILAASLRDLEFANPTDIQARMLRYFSSENHLFLAAETGSGKTVAYATPLISHIVRQKKRGRSCKGIVLVATSSLSHQTSAVLKKLAERTGVTVATPGNCENTPWDILVGTPGLVAKELGSLSSTDSISHMVLDEADFLLDESFVDVITDILSLVPVAHSETNLRNRTEGVKVIFCSASCPEELECIVEGVVDKAKLSYVKSGGLHKLPLSVDLTFVRVREMDKFERLGKLIDADLKRGQQNQTIVFCKDRITAKFVAGELKRSGRNAVLWKSYSSPLEIEEAKVIVATDAAARGLDLPCLSHVIQYDMSKHVVDYLHRIGRVGRLSSLFPGRVTAFVRTTPEIRVTNLIETAARRGKPLQSIETDIAGMLERKRVSDREE